MEPLGADVPLPAVMQGRWVEDGDPSAELVVDGGRITCFGSVVEYDHKRIDEVAGALVVALGIDRDDDEAEDAFRRRNITDLVVTPEGDFLAYNVKFVSRWVRQEGGTVVAVDAVVFDIGGVLVDSDYRHLYRKLIPDEREMEWFLATVCTQEWHQRHDAGRPMRDGVAELVARHPEHAELIRAWDVRFAEICAGPIEDTVALATELRDSGLSLYLLSNWPAEKFPIAQERFPFLVELFDGQVISGYEGVIKPDRRIFDLLSARYDLTPARTVFVDDKEDNVRAAAALGYQAIRFTGGAELRAAMRELGLV